MEGLKFSGVTLIEEEMVFYCERAFRREIYDQIFKRGYSFWTQEFHSDKSEARIVDAEGHLRYVAEDSDDVAVVPVLKISNFAGTSFKVGDTFNVKGLTFIIFSPAFAICLDNIGFAPFNDWTVYEYEDLGNIKDVVLDWYDFFIDDSDIVKIDPADMYIVMPMPKTRDRFQVVNLDGVVRHNARGHGFTSYEKAQNFINYWASHQPIPAEDLAAYNNHHVIIKEA